MKKILSLLAFALMSVASFAQGWVKPTAPQGVAPTDGLECYIMNAESGTFLTGAAVWHSWTTSTGLSADGQHSVLVKNGSNWYITRKSDGKHTFISGVLNADYGQAEGRWEMHVDMGSQGHDLFEIIEGANGAYRIRINANDDQYGADGQVWPEEMTPEQCQEAWEACFFGWLGAEHQYPSAIYANVQAGEGHIDWKFVTVEAFNEYHEGVAIYQAAMDLKKAIEDAEAECADPLIDLAEEKAVYNNPESTLEQLQAAIASVKAKVEKWKNDNELGKATLENPVDITSRMVNPGFDDIKGWNGSPAKGGDASNYCAEKYNCSFDVNQVVRNLPVGIYRIAAQGFYRHGNTNNASQGYTDGIEDSYEAYFYGNSVNAHIPSIYRDNTLCDESWGGAYVDSDPDNGRVPNNMTAASFIFANDLYKTDFFVYVYGTDTLKLGAKKAPADNPGGNWSIFDNFKLEYVGNVTESWNAFKEQYKKGIYVFPATTVAHKQLLADYNQAIADFNTATEPATIVELIETLNVLSDSIRKNVTAYEALAAKVEFINKSFENPKQGPLYTAWVNYMTNEDESKIAAVAGALNTQLAGSEYTVSTAYTPLVVLKPEAVSGCILSTPEATELVTLLTDINQYVNSKSIGDGDDATDLIVNASFAEGFTGWTRPLNNGRVGGINEYPNVEVWNAKVDIYQEVNAPNGLYELNCYAFERPTSGAYSGDGTEPAKVFLYMNDFKTGVMNIAKGAILKDDPDTEVGVNCVGDPATWPEGATLGTGQESDATWTDLEGNEYWMPNGQCGASVAFHAKRYKQTVYGLVENGKMKIGLTSNNVTCGWVLWSNFQLTYRASNADVAKTVLAGVVSQANDWFAANVEDLTDEAIENLSVALETGAQTEGKTGEQLLQDLKALYLAWDEAKAVLEIVAEMKGVYEDLNSAYELYAETATPEAQERAEELMGMAEDYYGLTTEQLKQLIEDMKECIDDLKLADPSQASDENPLDLTYVINNADMEKNADQDWSYTKKEGNGPNLGSGWDGKACEFWASNAANLEFNFWQTVKLAEGTYTVSVEAANSLNGQASLGNEGHAYLYAGIIVGTDTTFVNDLPVVVQEEGCTDKQDTYYVTFKVPAPTAKVILGIKSVGAMDGRWFVCDNFGLEYYGNQSSKEVSEGKEVIIEGVAATPTTVAPTAIFTISGARSNTLVKGINIVRMADGSVKKILK